MRVLPLPKSHRGLQCRFGEYATNQGSAAAQQISAIHLPEL